MKILIVDDEEANVKLLSAILSREGYDTLKAYDGETALAIVEKQAVDLILLDVMMPGISGFEVAKRVKAIKQIPIIMVTGLMDRDKIIEGFKSGADEFLSKPYLYEELLLRIGNILKVKEYQNNLESVVEERTKNLSEALRKLNIVNKEVMHRLLVAAEYRDDNTGKHVTRVGKYSRIIAEGLNLDKEYIDLIEQTAPMHDIGKIGISDLILNKPGKFTDEEFEIMKTHVIIGTHIIEKGESLLIETAYDIILNHHEKWTGKGYPNNTKGKDIPLSGRIVALADVFDALTSARPYKPGFSWDKSISIIKDEREKHFDPEVVDVFMNNREKVKSIYDEYSDNTLVKTEAV
ncbi:MAG: hypothetical protein A2231_11215 [Candidatus Firestonebacteria bacterium RIFOXYA2_FULL_40_8]|nr:MAG: hypothetical protein A2231_11215 [Candidatus Firestonebacteria bacterium RIFOXYA2_FULL_40_8]